MLLKPTSNRVKRLKMKKPSGPSRQAKEALAHVEDGWFPVNPDLLHEVQMHIEQGTYNDNPNLLIEQIKRDSALFFHVARGLKPLVSPDDRVTGFDPISQLKKLEIEKISPLLMNKPDEISKMHAFANPSKAQQSQHQLARLSAVTAEVFASKLSLKADHAFSNTLFRHLGRELIAWNYPLIYTRALTLHRTKGEPIENYLKRTIGISPQELSLRFARNWGMSEQIERTIQFTPPLDADNTERELHPDETKITMGELSQMSELYARSKDPANYPIAPDKWAARANAVEEMLGKDILLELEQRTQTVLAEEESSRSDTKIYVPPEQTKNAQQKALYEKNHYIEQLPSELQSEFGVAYQQIKDNELSIDAIRLLTDRIIPGCGFIRGCLFLQDKETKALEPALRFGETVLEDYKKFLFDSRNGIAAAISTSAATKKEGKGVRGGHINQICGSLRCRKNPGVLYLEIPDEVEASPTHDAVTFFHAIRQTIGDCLG